MDTETKMDPVRQRLVEMIDARGTTLAEVSRAIGKNHAYLQQFVKRETPRKLPEDVRKALARHFRVAESEFADTTSPRIVTPLPQLRPETLGRKDLPVYASAQGGADGEILIGYEPIEWRERPSILEGVSDAYAMYVVNDSMEPRYRQGDLLLIHPRRPVRQGCDVLLVKVNTNSEHHAMIKQLVRRTSEEVVLRQLNPPHEFVIPASEVKDVHLVMGAYWGGV